MTPCRGGKGGGAQQPLHRQQHGAPRRSRRTPSTQRAGEWWGLAAIAVAGAGGDDAGRGTAPYLVAGAAHDGGEHGPGGVIPGEAGLHQAGAVVAHERGGLVLVAHGVVCLRGHRGAG